MDLLFYISVLCCCITDLLSWLGVWNIFICVCIRLWRCLNQCFIYWWSFPIRYTFIGNQRLNLQPVYYRISVYLIVEILISPRRALWSWELWKMEKCEEHSSHTKTSLTTPKTLWIYSWNLSLFFSVGSCREPPPGEGHNRFLHCDIEIANCPQNAAFLLFLSKLDWKISHRKFIYCSLYMKSNKWQFLQPVTEFRPHILASFGLLILVLPFEGEM